MRSNGVRHLISTVVLTVACSSSDQNPEGVAQPATLEAWQDQLELRGSVDRREDGALRASVSLHPLWEPDGEEDCPQFELQAKINGVAVEVGSYHSSSNPFQAGCRMPAMSLVLDPALLRARQQVGFPEGLADTDVITRFEVELSDASGTLAYKFARDVPPWVEGQLIRAGSGPLQPGERVEIALQPAPVMTKHASLFGGAEQRWWLLPWEGAGDGGVGDKTYGQVAGFEQTPAGYAFQLPELLPDTSELRVSVWPWVEMLDCPFAHCVGGDAFLWALAPVSVTVQLPAD
jgi:hypothetical protein